MRRRLVAEFDRGPSAAAGTVAEAKKQEERTRQLGSNKFTAIPKHGKVIWNNVVSMLIPRSSCRKISSLRKQWTCQDSDMEFVKNFTQPDFQAKNFTPQKRVNCDIFLANQQRKCIKY